MRDRTRDGKMVALELLLEAIDDSEDMYFPELLNANTIKFQTVHNGVRTFNLTLTEVE